MLEKFIRSAVGFVAIAVFLIYVQWAGPTRAQVAGATLTGVVTDESGSGIPGANVAIKNVGTGVIREVTTNGDGLYSAPNLLPGEYEVTVSLKGFQTMLQKGITLSVGTQQALNISLKVGELNQTVEVTATPPTVQTTSSTISATVDANTVRELPLNGRDWTSLATLEPGVTSIPNQVGTGFSANKGNRGFGNQLSDAGHRANENTYRVNGININDYSNGAPGGATGLNLGVDGIQEFSVLTSDYTAEYGRTSGAVINAITKSGVNDFHGTAFFFDRDKIFDAKNYFDPPGPIPPFRRVQFGASGGRALIKDKTFLYGSYEGVRQNQPLAKVVSVPTQEARSGLLCTKAGANACASLTQVAVDPAIPPYLGLWPCPATCMSAVNADIVSFNVSLPGIASENYATGRVDQKLSDKDNLAASYFWDSGPFTQPDPLSNTIHSVFSRRQMASVEETHIFTPAFVNTVRVGLSRVRGDINLPVSGDAIATNSALAVAPGAAAPPEIRVTGVTTAIGLGGLNRFLHRWTSLQAYDDAFWTRGTQTIKLGFAFERMQYNVLEQLSPNGRMNTYSNIKTGPCTSNTFASSGLCRLLTNLPTRLNALSPGNSKEVGIRESLFAGYVQDDWRARSNLTINLGVRYEFTTLPKDANNMIQEITTITNCATPGVAPNPSSPCGPVHVNSFIASNPTTKNFEPRIGFSWDPFKDGKTAVRGGFGIFDVLPLPYEFGLNTSATAPFQIIGNGPARLGNGTAAVNFNPNVIRNRYVDQNPKRAYVMNWNFNIQREIAPSLTAIIGYVGSRSVHLSVAADDINLVPPVLTSEGILIPSNTYQLIPNWGGANGGVTPNSPGGSGIRPVIFDGESTYHGAQVQLKKTMSHGLQGQLSYTFGKCRDTSSSPVTGDTYVNSIAVPLLLSKQYRIGACDFDIRHMLIGTFIWEVPGPKSGIASYIAGGWQLGSIVTATSGSPFSVTVGAGGDPLNTGFNGDYSMDYANLVPGCNATPGVFPNPANTGQLLAFNPLCFTTAPAPTVGTGVLVGNSGRNNFYGPGLTTVDFSAFKNFRFTERLKFQFRAEFFNILNHPNFGAPHFIPDPQNNSINTPKTGVIDYTSTSARQIQLGAKLVW
ncbi:MAG TPA: carboxypeptidase regulatory-like domain-containing protein [Candidatus Dormibacteraeota bacterium]|nr:carboxypeptidase regulatory-like domain-containing protein [Candidatus Dormibacteraeota bacterium]